MISMFLCFLVTGLVTGLIAGLLGIGGGVITVPALYYILYFYGFPKEQIMHVSIATALAATCLTSLGSTWAHRKKGNILVSVLKIMVPGLFIGCLFGAILTYFLPSSALRMIFGSMALLFAVYFFFPHFPELKIASKPNKSLLIFGVIYGCLSTLLGVGGGIFMVPTLIGYQLSLRNVIGTSSAGTLATASFGTVAYLIIAHNISLPRTIGYIEISAFLTIGISSLFTTSLGVKLAHVLPTPLIKRIFAVALFVTGTTMLLGH